MPDRRPGLHAACQRPRHTSGHAADDGRTAAGRLGVMTPGAVVYCVTSRISTGREEAAGGRGPSSVGGAAGRAYADAALAFARECGVPELTIRDPECHFEPSPDRRPLDREHPLAKVLGQRLEGWVDGARLPTTDAVDVIRWMLRLKAPEEHLWCRLEDGDAFAIHVDADQPAMYVRAPGPCPGSVGGTTALGLRADPTPSSPYERDPDDVDTDARVADAAFWADVADLAHRHGAAEIVEHAAWPRYWTMFDGGTPPTTRPGSRVVVWAQWRSHDSTPRRTLLRVLHGRTRRHDDRARDAAADIEVAPGLVWHGTGPAPDAYEEAPALRGVTPGADGTVSAVWPAWVVDW